VSATGGTLGGSSNYFYAVSAIDGSDGESPLSFIAQARTAAGGDTSSVVVNGIGLPAAAATFNMYRGTTAHQLFRIASSQPPAVSFTDTGLPIQAILPPDPQFDHVNIYWRWELLPETAATSHSATTIGNSALQLATNQYTGATVRITRGTGAGQERPVKVNDGNTITVSSVWTPAPDATSFFVISEGSWRFGARGSASPIPISVVRANWCGAADQRPCG